MGFPIPRTASIEWLQEAAILRYLVAGLVMILLAPGVAAAADPPPANPVLIEATEFPGYAMFAESGAPGMVLVVVRGESSVVLGYGETERGNDHIPDGRSLFRLNSIAKVFATEVLASLTAEGRVRLTDTLQQHAGGRQVPQLGPLPITLLDLATYSAGMPRDMGEEPAGRDPRTWPNRAERWQWLAGNPLRWAPGTAAAYSNVGFDLIADALEEATGQFYPALLRDRVTAAAGMTDTTATPTPEQCARLMIGTGLAGAGCGPVRGGEPARIRPLRGADGRGERLGGEPRHTLTHQAVLIGIAPVGSPSCSVSISMPLCLIFTGVRARVHSMRTPRPGASRRSRMQLDPAGGRPRS